MKIRELCTQSQFEALHTAIDKTRKGSGCVKVDIQALKNLLVDHAALHTITAKI